MTAEQIADRYWQMEEFEKPDLIADIEAAIEDAVRKDREARGKNELEKS